jgi:hypothetical protein
MEQTHSDLSKSVPWNIGKLMGQRPPLKLKEVWAIRVRLEISGNLQELALFNLAIDSKLRSCDLVTLKVSDVSNSFFKTLSFLTTQHIFP